MNLVQLAHVLLADHQTVEQQHQLLNGVPVHLGRQDVLMMPAQAPHDEPTEKKDKRHASEVGKHEV